jgi:hypothetical protein
MKDDAERARECLRATIRAHNVADDDNDITIWPDEEAVVVAAMLAFAQQQPEGWIPSDHGGYRVPDLRFNAGKLCRGYVPCGDLSRWPTHWMRRPAPPAAMQQPEEWVLVPRVLLRDIFSDYMTSQNHHPNHVLIPTDKFEDLRAIFDNHTPAAMLDVAPIPGEE